LNIERKLKNFAKMAENEAEKNRREIINKTDSNIAGSLEKIKKKAVEEAEKALASELSELKQMQKRELARYESEARKKLILKREEMLKELKELAEKSLLEYIGSYEYNEWLYKAVEAELHANPGAAITVRPKDYERLESIINITFSNEVVIGGYKLVSANGKKVVDNSFEAKLSELIENFQGFALLELDRGLLL